jgi:hypothetical protein
MDKNFTLNRLIQLTYGELTNQERSELLKELVTSFEMNESLQDVLSVQDKLNEDMLEPSATSLQIVLDHSRNNQELETFC